MTAISPSTGVLYRRCGMWRPEALLVFFLYAPLAVLPSGLQDLGTVSEPRTLLWLHFDSPGWCNQVVCPAGGEGSYSNLIMTCTPCLSSESDFVVGHMIWACGRVYGRLTVTMVLFVTGEGPVGWFGHVSCAQLADAIMMMAAAEWLLATLAAQLPLAVSHCRHDCSARCDLASAVAVRMWC